MSASEPSSSLSSVVSNLVRAQMGTSLSPTVTDEDLDRHVAELILREAKKKAERYSQTGIRAYLTSAVNESNAPRTNKRFLSSIIRSTDDHNRSVLRQQAEAAQEIKMEREAQERRERRRRAEEAVQAEKRRGRRVDDEEAWDRWDGRKATNEKRPKRKWEIWNGDHDDDSESSLRYRRHRSRSNRYHDSSNRHSRRSRSRSRSVSYDEDIEDKHRSRRHEYSYSSHRHSRRSKSPVRRTQSPSAKGESSTSRVRSPSPRDRKSESHKERERHTASTIRLGLPADGSENISHSSSPEPEPAHHVPSKMDKYFEDSYDPRLDVAPLSMTPLVPATGLIDSTEFDGWDAMLELLRQRKEDKEERRRLERLGLLPKDKSKRRAGTSTTSFSPSDVADRWNTGGTSVMKIEYSKRGAVREWDLGKDGST
ncbi:hypothetical protein FISHEDRAFT_64701 [Fistulina hepatica ATCC 64428]|uniref:Uncharacterized protein n=1 Tax=Fistulina hepatica ATCC 64428 TaxID=1128425 RepID=A0A0D7AH72_9AGAR|nr:hypothetical protein FISHEDRAFT_64701 [Fistulina hepatica ATCC 64428]